MWCMKGQLIYAFKQVSSDGGLLMCSIYVNSTALPPSGLCENTQVIMLKAWSALFILDCPISHEAVAPHISLDCPHKSQCCCPAVPHMPLDCPLKSQCCCLAVLLISLDYSISHNVGVLYSTYMPLDYHISHNVCCPAVPRIPLDCSISHNAGAL